MTRIYSCCVDRVNIQESSCLFHFINKPQVKISTILPTGAKKSFDKIRYLFMDT